MSSPVSAVHAAGSMANRRTCSARASSDSMSTGEMFFPPEVMISSFFRSAIVRKPSVSSDGHGGFARTGELAAGDAAPSRSG